MKKFALKSPVPTENQEQESLIKWSTMAQGKYPELRWLFAVPNGGIRQASTAARLKREGVKAGVSDLCLPVARGGYHGLYIEMKRQKGGVLSPDQKEFLAFANAQGYLAVECRGWEAAKRVIEEYLESK